MWDIFTEVGCQKCYGEDAARLNGYHVHWQFIIPILLIAAFVYLCKYAITIRLFSLTMIGCNIYVALTTSTIILPSAAGFGANPLIATPTIFWPYPFIVALAYIGLFILTFPAYKNNNIHNKSR